MTVLFGQGLFKKSSVDAGSGSSEGGRQGGGAGSGAAGDDDNARRRGARAPVRAATGLLKQP
jgi:hypothetical protein